MLKTMPRRCDFCEYLLVEVTRSSESAGAVADVGLTAAHWDTVVPGFFKPAGVPPVRVVVNSTAVELQKKNSSLQLPSKIEEKYVKTKKIFSLPASVRSQ